MKRPPFLVLLFCSLLLLPVTFSQNNLSPDSLEKRVGGLFSEKNYDAVIALVQPYLKDAGEKSNWSWYSDLTADLAQAFHFKKEHQQALAIVQEAIERMTKGGASSSVACANLWVWKALQQNKMEQFDQCLESYKTAIGIFESNNFKGPKLAYCYKNAAQIYLRYSNDLQAINYLEAALSSDTSRTQNASVYAQLASLFLALDSVGLAQKYYDLGCSEPSIPVHYQASLNYSGALLNLRKGDFGNAANCALEALRYYQSDPTLGDNRIRAFTTLAEIAALQNQPREAEHYFRKAEAEGKTFYKGKSREMAKLYVETGLFYEQQKQTGRALEWYQKALIQAFPRFNSLKLSDNPPVAEAGLESQAMRAAAAKAHALLKKIAAGASGGATADWRVNAAHCFDLSFAVAAKLRRTYGNDADKFALAASNRAAYDAAALNLWQLWKETGDQTHLARLFAFFEQSKAQALGDALQQQRALALTGIPDSSLDKENNLRLEAAIAAKDLKEKELSGDSTEVVRQKERAFRLGKAYDDFLKTLEQQYPQFRQYTQADLTANLSVIQAALADTALLLSWYDAGDRYLCVTVHHNDITAHEVGHDSLLAQTLSAFLATLADKNAQQSDPAACFAAAHNLYQQLCSDKGISSARSLIIAPDGLLCYLPFEALLTAPHTGGYGNAPYLLRSKTVQYVWSATLLTLPETGKPPENGLLHVAPFAAAARDNLAVLPNSLRDAPSSVGAAVLNGAEATADEFLKNASRFNALHLSTHADAGGRDVPGIEFYDRRLTLPEIYAQRLHASLVSLSACETGAGRFAEGEGVLSLARAFAYAGARSLVASHWQVNERSTAELFAAFYENLNKGLSKAEALRLAKLRYLASPEPDARKAPFHWAAFTLTGSDGTVTFEKNSLLVWLFTGIGLLLAAVLLRWFFRSYFSKKRGF